MGIFRLLLALSVLTSHSPIGQMFAGGQLAVEGFFVISGFYMALLLHTGRYSSTSTFYASRWWRLWPMFLLVTLVCLTRRETGTNSWFERVGDQTWPWEVLMMISTFFMAGLDVLFYGEWNALLTGVPGGTGNQLLLIPPAWSLSLELAFVLLAPWLTRLSSATLLSIVVLTETTRQIGLFAGLDPVFWGYRFFPFEAGLFILGILAYRSWREAPQNYRLPWQKAALLLLPTGLTILAWPLADELKRALWLVMVAGGIPGLFNFTKNSSWDRWLGELSYPVYLWHMFALRMTMQPFGKWDAVPLTLLSAAITIGVSILTIKYLQDPVDRWRHKWVRRGLKV